MFGDFFQYCRFDNPVFLSGLIWGVIFIITLTKVVHFKLIESREKAIEDEIIRKYLAEQDSKQATAANRKPTATLPDQSVVRQKSAKGSNQRQESSDDSIKKVKQGAPKNEIK